VGDGRMFSVPLHNTVTKLADGSYVLMFIRDVSGIIHSCVP